LSVQKTDVIYIAGAAHDARYTRICVASVRRAYPTLPVRILSGGPLEAGLARELAQCWDVGLADLPRRDYGWGFVKLEPLFGPAGERFLVLDSDTVITGPVLDAWDGADGPFLVDDERQTEADARRLYYDWERLRAGAPQTRAPVFLFNSGQWFGTAGVLSRADFESVLAWSEPPQLRFPDCFMGGDQGVLNWVLNQKAGEGAFTVGRKAIMRWPKHSMAGLSAAEVAAGEAPALAVHWAGLKKPRLSAMPGADLLAWFEQLYYERVPNGPLLRATRSARYALPHKPSPRAVLRKAGRALRGRAWA
jgi:hypothetical protein